MLAKNKSGWIVHEYLDVSEGDIGYVDECDVAIAKTVFCKR